MRNAILVSLAIWAGCGAGEMPPADGPTDLAARPTMDAAIPHDGAGAADLASPPADLAGAPPSDLATPANPAQTPPMGRAALEAWLARGDYKQWRCEPAPHPTRPPGAHGENRICSNDLLSGSAGPGEFPVGSASVKELFSNGQLRGYAVGLRVSAGAGGSHWYWYERAGQTIYADGIDVPLCSGCHAGAPRDFVFTQVK